MEKYMFIAHERAPAWVDYLSQELVTSWWKGKVEADSLHIYNQAVKAPLTSFVQDLFRCDNAIASLSTYPCQWVGEWVIHSFRLEIAIASTEVYELVLCDQLHCQKGGSWPMSHVLIIFRFLKMSGISRKLSFTGPDVTSPKGSGCSTVLLSCNLLKVLKWKVWEQFIRENA